MSAPRGEIHAAPAVQVAGDGPVSSSPSSPATASPESETAVIPPAFRIPYALMPGAGASCDARHYCTSMSAYRPVSLSSLAPIAEDAAALGGETGSNQQPLPAAATASVRGVSSARTRRPIRSVLIPMLSPSVVEPSASFPPPPPR